jgi:hypothetical protein
MRSGKIFLSYAAACALALATAGSAGALGVNSVTGALPTGGGGGGTFDAFGVQVSSVGAPMPNASLGHVRVPNIAVTLPSTPSGVAGHSLPSGGNSSGYIAGHQIPSIPPGSVSSKGLDAVLGSLGGPALGATLPSSPSGVAGHKIPSGGGGGGVPYSVAKHLPTVLP